MNAAIVLAGGQSERMPGLGLPKQFAEVSGKPMILYSLLAFQQCVDISAVVVVAPAQWQEKLSAWMGEHNISMFSSFAEPGRARQLSIYNGLLALRKTVEDRDVVVIHDAARPCVTTADIQNCIVCANGYDGATPVLPLTDTVYKSTNGKVISALLNRDELFAGQTPECYVYGKYLAAHGCLSETEIEAIRGSSEIAFMSGMNVRIFEGNRGNFKVTTAEDMAYFTYIEGRNR